MNNGNTDVLRIEGISKLYGTVKAVDDVHLSIKEGEVFTLLGPSGCGKTTTLRQIAGLEQPDEGNIYFRDTLLVSVAENVFVPTHKRQMGMVFQSYAIWPNLTIFDTVAYPLKARNVKKSEVRRRVMDTLELVGLKGIENRPGPMLSGGQQQRVALARALVYEPDILLLDEPFSNLDVKLREQMRIELKLLQRRVGVTVIMVTHDQIEALSLSNRIALMNRGRIEQVGTPKELYEKPQTAFVRDFIGKCITLSATITGLEEERVNVTLADGETIALAAKNNFVPEPARGSKGLIAIRPEDILINAPASEEDLNFLEGELDALLFVGDRLECRVMIGGAAVLVYAPRGQTFEEGMKVRLSFPSENISLWPQ